jgi:hypothetical protein
MLTAQRVSGFVALPYSQSEVHGIAERGAISGGKTPKPRTRSSRPATLRLGCGGVRPPELNRSSADEASGSRDSSSAALVLYAR